MVTDREIGNNVTRLTGVAKARDGKTGEIPLLSADMNNGVHINAHETCKNGGTIVDTAVGPGERFATH